MASRWFLLLSLVTGFVAGPAGFGGRAVALQTESPPAGYYESPTFGYLIQLDSAKWQVTEQQSNGSADHLVLSGAAGVVAFDGYTGFNGDPDACLAAEEARVAQDPGITHLAVAADLDGNRAEVHAPGWTYRIYTLVATDANGARTPMTLTIDCRTLVPNSAVLEVRHYVPLSSYAEAVRDADVLMHAVVLARPSVKPITTFDDTFLRTENMTYVVGTSEVAAIAVTSLDETPSTALPAAAPEGTHWVSAKIEFRNSGHDPLKADAGAPYLVDEYGGVTNSAYYRWIFATGDPNAPVQPLGTGTEVLLLGWFAVAGNARVASVECDCFPSLGYGTRTITSFRPRLGETGPLDHDYYDCQHYPRRPVLVLDRNGNEVGLVTVVDFVQPGAKQGDQLVLAVENSGNAPWTFDPRNVVVWGVGNAWPSDVQWLSGVSAGGGRTIALGGRDVVRLTFPSSLQPGAPLVLYAHYWASKDQEVFLASLVGCQGTAGRPVIRTTS
jgi:hypothetical protein